MARGLTDGGHVDLGATWTALTAPRIRRILWFTVWQAAASAGLCLMLGLPVAFLLYRRRFLGRTVMRALLTAPFVLPTVVIGLAFRTLLASSGPLGGWHLDQTVWAILAAHVCIDVSVVIRTVGAAWAGLDPRPAEAAASLGGQLLTLQFSRSDESEADLVGLELAARAGYQPAASVSLWKKMGNASGSKQGGLAFLSTHPSGPARIRELELNVPKVQGLYEQARKG